MPSNELRKQRLTQGLCPYDGKTSRPGFKLCTDCRERRNQRRVKDTAAVKAFLLEAKSKPCTDCGKCFDPVCMDFDHLFDKTYDVSDMSTKSLELVKQEVSKCELVCACCHRLRTKLRKSS